MSFKLFQAMLAAPVNLDKLVFPVLASPKFDGIRCTVVGAQAMTRNLKLIPNEFVRYLLQRFANNRDGELIFGDPCAPDCFNVTTRAVMSRDGTPDVKFYVFDKLGTPQVPFHQRLNEVHQGPRPDWMVPVEHVVINTREQLDTYETEIVEKGWEGVMLRHPDGWYKYGRSTVREGGLLKMKRFKDADAKVVGFEELMHNDNVATVNALGRTERSSHQENMRGAGVLGALIVEYNGAELRIGTGFDAAQRANIWLRRDMYKYATVVFKYQEVGTKDAPRFPVFKGFRSDL